MISISSSIPTSLIILCLLSKDATSCHIECANCNQEVCESCHEGFWLNNNECSPCPQNCKTCRDNTTCFSCMPQFRGTGSQLCKLPCSNNCSDSDCNDLNGYCKACIPGKYGPVCTENCSLCRNTQCALRSCLDGCDDGYVQVNSSDFSYCFPCPQNCTTCLNTTYCTQCYEQYFANNYISDYGRGVANCQPCSGSCTECSSILHCSSCIRMSARRLACNQCKDGYVFEQTTCVKRETSCPITCKEGCDTNGMCLGGCSDGYLGQYCSYKCLDNCRSCETQDLCVSCKDGYYTGTCSKLCNQNCLRGGSPMCRFNDGYCLNGCTADSWGDTCENKCSQNCRSEDSSSAICHRNGSCVYGCSDGFSGSDCGKEDLTTTTTTKTQTTTTSTTTHTTTLHTKSIDILTSSSSKETTDLTLLSGTVTQSKLASSNQNVPVAAIGGGVGGGVVLLIIVILLVCLVIRRNRKRNDQPNVGSHGKSEAVNPMFDPEMPDAMSIQQKSSQPIDYIYAQPNKPKKPMPSQDSMKDPQTKVLDGIEIDTHAERDAGGETDSEDTVILEDLDDGDGDITVTETVAPTSDTYYNTEGLIRSRIQVSKLLDYIKDKSDFQSEFERLPQKLTRSCNEAINPQNRAKNRYNGIYSYDATRVVLKSKEYINASHIEGYNTSKAYIASLGPTKSTMPEFEVFWEMVWQENTQKIVMLTNLMESGKNKCDQYWPDNGSSRQYGSVFVSTKAEHIFAEFVERELLIVKAGESRTVTQYHYTAWPDKSMPDTVVSLVEFRDMVEKKKTPNAGPMIVHCSAGIGRTGTYIALDSLIKEGKAENSVDIFGCVNALRGQRVHMVQNLEQYVFLHHCVVYALTCQPGPLDVSSLTSYTRDDNMNAQFQAIMNLPPLANKESDSIATNTKRKENRKGSDIPGDLYRVKLEGTKKEYINAVFVDGYLQKNRYILAQTPMPSTLEDFVSILYQEKIGLVVSLDEEDGKDKTTGQYVAPANKVSKIGHFTVSTISCESSEDFVVRILRISKIGQSNANDVNIRHYQFQGWKNTDSVPGSLQAFMSLIRAVNKHCRPESGKVLFHCLDGATKSGLLCAVAIMLEKLAVERELSIINTICQVRGRRRKVLHEFDQFKFCYNCVREHLETSEAKAYYNIL